MPKFGPEFIDELKTRLRPSDVVGRHVKLRKQGNEWAGLSPFTKEKTPSFFVNDQKGFYHCFSSGKHGDIISFLQETQGLTFVEAITSLAQEAGMEIPADDPQAERQASVRKGLVEACNEAARFFSQMLGRGDGRAAAEYLETRGVTAQQIAEFRIGYAPSARAALKDYLINKGFDEATLIEAGLLIKPDDGSASFDKFRNRIMFPIAGTKDDVIAFGGRALDPGAKAKYLNSPATPIFHKGSVLYRFEAARRVAYESQKPLIVCEGYMDVIALWGAGFKTAVAPLGTALTENQLALLWRVSDEPILCFDGDKAGIGAAYRSIDRALPDLKPGKSLQFVFLPEGKDPDDLVKQEGPVAFQALLDKTENLIDCLWRRETESRDLTTPERRAALRAHLRSLVKGIGDADVRNAYAMELVERLRTAFSPPGANRPGLRQSGGFGSDQSGGSGRSFTGWRRFRSDHERKLFEAKPSSDLRRESGLSASLRDATLVLASINHPELVERQELAFLELVLENPGLDMLLSEVMAAILAEPGLDSDGLKGHLRKTQAADELERVLANETLNRQSFLWPDTELDEVEAGWKDALRHHLIVSAAARDLSESAAQTFQDGENIWKAAVTARDALVNSGQDTDKSSRDDGATLADLEERLEQMRKNVSQKRRH